MPHPSEEELVDLASRPEEAAADVVEHVGSCDECRVLVAELENAAAHLRTVPDIDDGWVALPAGLWDRVVDELDHPAAGVEAREPAAVAPEPAPPVAVPEPVGAPVAAPAPPAVVSDLADRRAAPRRRPWLVAGLAAASLAVGLLAGRAIWGGEPEQGTSIVVTAPLDTLDTKQREGSAAIERIDGHLDLRVATTNALDAGDGYLEVWLINRDLKRMVSVGVLRSGQTGVFPVSQALLDQGYVIVDVSREAFDDKPQHSGISLLRGQLPA